MQNERIDICPICGKEMTVVGRTTMHYECLECNKEREKFIKDVTELFVTDNTRQNLFEDIADYILQEKSQSFAEGKKQGVIETCNKFIDFTQPWIDNCIKFPSMVAEVQKKIFKMYKRKLEESKLHAEQSLAEGK